MTRSRVVLLGWYGSDNTGDEALLQSILQALRSRGISHLHALSIDPAKTTARFGVAASKRSLFDRTTWRALRGANALILGGGGLIQDRTSVYNLPIYAAFVLLARMFGLTVIGWGLGVEPLDTRLGKFLARYIVRSSAYFSVRDAGSRRLLVRAGVSPDKITVSTDPAFLLRFSEDAPRREDGRSVIVFCLRDLPDNRPGLNLHYVLPISIRRRLGLLARDDTPRVRAFAHAAARGVKVAVEELGANVRFLPLWPGRDAAIIELVTDEAVRLGVPGDRLELINDALTPMRVAAEASSADLLVSMRLHALIFAASRGVPGLALAYARKMRGLMRSLGMERWVVEVETRNPPPEEIEMKLRTLWEMRASQQPRVQVAAEAATRRAQADADCIAHLLASGPPGGEGGRPVSQPPSPGACLTLLAALCYLLRGPGEGPNRANQGGATQA